MENVNKQLLDALKEAVRLIAELSIAATGCEVTEERIDKVVRIARNGSAVQRFRDMIAAAEQAQADDAEAEWLRLALQFDGHRLQAAAAQAPDLMAQLRALAKQHGWNFVRAKARLIEEGTKTCHKCHGSGLTHSCLCVHYDKAKEQEAMAEYRAAAQKGGQ